MKLARVSRAAADFMTDPFSKRLVPLIAQLYGMMAERTKKITEEGTSLK
jgi:hypothetical protein